MVYLSWLLWFESNLEAKNEVIPAGGGGCSPGEVGVARWENFLLLRSTLGALFRSVLLVQGGREVQQNTINLEKAIYFKRGKVHVDSKYLIQSTYPVYVLICNSQKVKLRLEQIEDSKRFSIGRWALEKKLHLLKWIAICKDRSKGGLGIRSIPSLNQAFLDKQSRRSLLKGKFSGNRS